MLSDLDGLLEVVIGQPGIDDLVAVLDQVGRFDATGDGLPTVKEENLHGSDSAQERETAADFCRQLAPRRIAQHRRKAARR